MPRHAVLARWSCLWWLLVAASWAASPAGAQETPADLARKVRALGQTERPTATKETLPLLAHGSVEVRREAANALGQALFTVSRSADAPPPPELATATTALLARLRVEPDAVTRGIVAESLGRLPHRSLAAIREAEQQLRVRLQDAHPLVAAGAAKGLDALIRNTGKVQPPEAATLSQLRMAAGLGSDPSDADLALVRRLAWLALSAAGPVDMATIERGYEDPDLQVRRRAILALGAASGTAAERRALLQRGLADSAFQVRYEAVRVYSRTLQAEDCAPVLAAIDDVNAHVSLAAVDALGNGCAAGPNPVPRLTALTGELPKVDNLNPNPDARVPWHRPAHAFVALARVAREPATPLLASFGEHPIWQVRMYAARAATALAAAARLERLASDADDNVRHAAIEGLRSTRRHAADAFYVDALARRDYQLVMLAAQALEGSPDPAAAVPALVAAFSRLSAEKRDTSRDTRLALLARLKELGSQAQAGALRPCLADADPVIAAECAALLRTWTGVAALPTPVTRAAAAPHLRPAVEGDRLRLTMARGGVIEVRLYNDVAPASSARVAQLARQGYYNGLSFWRVAPGFVLQGGSPGSNEYSGDGPFMRDELGLRGNVRGTIGLSTRGRHTGDAQFFVNLLDNPRLDHDFTVFGEITAGMDIADAVLEGDIIARVDVLGTPSASR
jgi:cyclophilin family peptidyl-prolyl cis-trans isomerase/HEAT repeat protein